MTKRAKPVRADLPDCPICFGGGEVLSYGRVILCDACNGSGKSKPLTLSPPTRKVKRK